MPISTPNTKVAFNDVSFGFVPHGGSTYYLSRLPGELGTFLSLTGVSINGVDAKEAGLADGLIHTTETYEQEVADVLNAMDWPIPTGYHLSNRFKIDR